MNTILFNYLFNKNKLKTLLMWCMINGGQYEMIRLAENLKYLGFKYATEAGISLGIDDLKTISKKGELIKNNQNHINSININFDLGKINEIEKSNNLIQNWQKVSEIIKQDISNQFNKINKLNPIYMMAFSGARGNISQVRQLIGMRGLMADPNGQIIHLPIKSNFREGLTITEYLISCYGARKGVVDTALRTATAGYLTRRLVDTVQHVVISELDCKTTSGIFLSNLYNGNIILLSLKQQLIGRLLGKNIFKNNGKILFYRNRQLDEKISNLLGKKYKKIFVRSSLNCQASNLTVCQLCYGWNLAHLKLVSLGEVIGVIAAQSIGEPGTQLTMRTFHTGGVFSGDVKKQMYAPFNGTIFYSSYIKGNTITIYRKKLAFLVQQKGSVILNPTIKSKKYNLSLFELNLKSTKFISKIFEALPYTILFVKNNEEVKKNQLIAQKSSYILKDQQIEIRYTVNSKVEGEIFFEKLSLNNQRIWILYGKIYKPLLPLKFFPRVGDIIYKKFPLAQIKILNTSACFLQTILLKNNIITNSNDYKQNYQFLIYTEYQIYSFNLEDINIVDSFCFFSLQQNIYTETEKILRIKFQKKLNLRIRIPYYKVAKNSNIFPYYVKLEYKQKFLKDLKNNKIVLYNEKILENLKFDKLQWIIPELNIKNNSIIIYESVLLLNKKNTIKKNLLIIKEQSKNENIISNLNKKLFLVFYKRNNFPREKIFFIKKFLFNIFINTSDLKKFSKYLNFTRCYSINFNFINRKICLHPITFLRYQFNTYGLNFINSNQNKIKISTPNFIEINIHSNISYFSLNEIKLLNKNNKSNIFCTSFIFSILLNNLSLYRFTKNFNKLLNFAKNKLIYLSKIDNKNFYIFSKLLLDFFTIIKFLGNIFYSQIFYKKNLISKYLLNFSHHILLIDNSKTILISSKKTYLTNEILNSFIFLEDRIIKNFINHFISLIKNIAKYSIKNKALINKIFPTFYIKNFMIQSNGIKPNVYWAYYYLLTFKIINGWVNIKNYSTSSFKFHHKDNQILFTNTVNYFEPTNFPKFLKEFCSCKEKLIFWRDLNISFVKKYFFLDLTFTKYACYNYTVCKSRKLTKMFDIFKTNSNFFITNFLIQIGFDLFNKKTYINLLNNIFVKIDVFSYCFLKLINESKFIYNIDYKKRFINQNKTISKILLFEKFQELLINNNYYSLSSNLLSFKSSFFNKKYLTKIHFSNLYKHINLCFHISFPLLKATILIKNNNFFQCIIKNYFSCSKPMKIINRVSIKNISNIKIEKQNYTEQLKLINSNLSNIILYYNCSLIQQILKKIIDKNDKKHFINNKLIFSSNHLNWLPRLSSILKISFFSPYEGEIITNKLLLYSNDNILYNQLMILTSDEQRNFSIIYNYKQKYLLKVEKDKYFINKPKLYNILFNVGSLVELNSIVSPGKNLLISGKLLSITDSNIILRKGKPLLSPLHGIFYIWNNDFIKLDSSIMTLLFNKLKTGDIVQGIPKIEHFFEARKNIIGINNKIQNDLSMKLNILFLKFKCRLTLNRAVKRSIAKLQKIIIDGICRVYCSQGIIISRKHFEIIIRQMTCKVKIIEGGETGLLEGEFINFDKIENINHNIHYKRTIYEPLILGITKTSLKTESFISSASFQETAKVLTQAALERKIDFLNGLKENVIIGRLVIAGTGLITNILMSF